MRRALLRAWLDLPTDVPPAAAYVRVLAVGVRGRDILREMKQTCALPVIVKPVTERALPDEVQPLLAHDALADDLYALAYPNPAYRVGGGRYRQTPFCLE